MQCLHGNINLFSSQTANHKPCIGNELSQVAKCQFQYSRRLASITSLQREYGNKYFNGYIATLYLRIWAVNIHNNPGDYCQAGQFNVERFNMRMHGIAVTSEHSKLKLKIKFVLCQFFGSKNEEKSPGAFSAAADFRRLSFMLCLHVYKQRPYI